MNIKGILVVFMLLFGVIPAYAVPYCPSGSECGTFMWNASKNAFSCGYGTCECGSKTYNCYMPCDSESNCNTFVYDWQSICSDGSDDCGVEMQGFLSCADDLASGICNQEWQYYYRCARGYYGNPTASNQNVCVRCPKFDDVQGTTPGAGATVIGDCYLPSGSKLSDTTGKYEFSEDCYY
ncbi:MAG: hypothetical protein Q4E56_03780 [Pseudomonadota bacterium]|nr:hypothetical protein [Pseudomonadota bacterium]